MIINVCDQRLCLVFWYILCVVRWYHERDYFIIQILVITFKVRPLT